MTVIRVENLGKCYRLGEKHHDRYDTFRNMLSRSASSLIKRVRTCGARASQEEFWALNDVSFEVKQGERMGVIGRNGAGKSTLLKLLSRITEPTTGRITMRGRVGSLLEVGTGFHPELTGRENIYLNGAVLGMSRAEIRAKFDAIVAFAEVEKFLDTPVKRYSSGMYVRLAFAVAAHLEPEVLIVDEVLAVGDAQFQKKCMGKMDEFGRSGRTVLFVSHNMGAITQFCTNCVLLDRGRLEFVGDAMEASHRYIQGGINEGSIDPRQFQGPLSDRIRFDRVTFNGSGSSGQLVSPKEELVFVAQGECVGPVPPVRLSFVIYTCGTRVATFHDCVTPQRLEPGRFEAEVRIPAFALRPGEYSLRLGGHSGDHLSSGDDWLFGNDLMSFIVTEEWSFDNDFANVGIVNIPHTGRRSQ